MVHLDFNKSCTFSCKNTYVDFEALLKLAGFVDEDGLLYDVDLFTLTEWLKSSGIGADEYYCSLAPC